MQSTAIDRPFGIPGAAIWALLGGLADGIQPHSAPLAALLVGDIAYVGFGVVISLR